MYVTEKLRTTVDAINHKYMSRLSGDSRAFACHSISPSIMASFLNEDAFGVNYVGTIAAAEALMGASSNNPHKPALIEIIKCLAVSKASSHFDIQKQDGVFPGRLNCTTAYRALEKSGRAIEALPSVEPLLHPMASAKPSALFTPFLNSSARPEFVELKPVLPIFITDSERNEDSFGVKARAALRCFDFLLRKDLRAFDEIGCAIHDPALIVVRLPPKDYAKYVEIIKSIAKESDKAPHDAIIETYSDILGMMIAESETGKPLFIEYFELADLIEDEAEPNSSSAEALAANSLAILKEHLLNMASGAREDITGPERHLYDIVAQAIVDAAGGDTGDEMTAALSHAGCSFTSAIIDTAIALHYKKYIESLESISYDLT